MNKKKRLTIIFVLLLASFLCYSQKKNNNSKIELSLTSNSYSGDLEKYKRNGIGAQIGIRFFDKKKLNGGLYIGTGKVYGNNEDYIVERNPLVSPPTFFQTSFVNFGYNLRFNILNTKKIIFYVSQGIGIFSFNSKNENGINLSSLKTFNAPNESINSFSFSLPNSIGVVYKLKNNYSFGLEIGYLNTRTDYIDNIGAWSNNSKNDNILQTRFQLLIPFNNKNLAISEENTDGKYIPIRSPRFR